MAREEVREPPQRGIIEVSAPIPRNGADSFRSRRVCSSTRQERWVEASNVSACQRNGFSRCVCPSVKVQRLTSTPTLENSGGNRCLCTSVHLAAEEVPTSHSGEEESERRANSRKSSLRTMEEIIGNKPPRPHGIPLESLFTCHVE